MKDEDIDNKSFDFSEIFVNDIPLIDTRAPVEFAKGAFPCAVNLPLMTDDERHRVGTCYKQHGQEAAIALGYKLVNGDIKQQRVAAWVEFAKQHPQGFLYCFRGGLRSRISQEWLEAALGSHYPRIPGGYKALRAFLMQQQEEAVTESRFVLIGGLTGSGKTELLRQLENGVDLECHANHRGSGFGRRATPQPAQIDFENALAVDFLKRRKRHQQQFVLEDEGRIIGSCALPLSLYRGMQSWPLVWLEETQARRLERVLRDYVVEQCCEQQALLGNEAGFERFAEDLRKSLAKIVKRLGHARYVSLDKAMQQALEEQRRTGDVSAHRIWIIELLENYYDPMYRWQSEKKSGRFVFRGDHDDVLAFLQREYAPSR